MKTPNWTNAVRRWRKSPKAKTIEKIEASKLRMVRTMNTLRIWVGLPLVQGSSILALFDQPLLFYWITLEFGLLDFSAHIYFQSMTHQIRNLASQIAVNCQARTNWPFRT